MELDYECNSWQHWSPLMTHSVWWYCEAIFPAPGVLYLQSEACFPGAAFVHNGTVFYNPVTCTLSRRVSGGKVKLSLRLT